MDIRELIMEKSGDMSPIQKHIATAIMNAPEPVAFMTAAQLGRYASVSEASVVRFVRVLGFSRYNEFKKALSHILIDRLSTTERSKDLATLTDEGLYASVLQREIDVMVSAKENLRDDTIDTLGRAIAASPAVYVCSCRSSHSLGYYLAFYLSWFLPRVRTLEHASAFEVLGTAPAESIVIGISFPRYTRWTVNILRHAHASGLTVATLTNDLGSPLASISKFTLTMPYRLVSFIDSFAVPMSVINCLILSVFRACGEEGRVRLERLEKIWRKENTYIK
ncbi:MAG: MurR/RpiR family transcriptional regulator [Synergistaceae bacterium]|nr:MurR/RpiR family transcriptional regulator [Synergistaceae bacterium]